MHVCPCRRCGPIFFSEGGWEAYWTPYAAGFLPAGLPLATREFAAGFPLAGFLPAPWRLMNFKSRGCRELLVYA
eukprot:3222442-Amphidinium_carterae.1